VNKTQKTIIGVGAISLCSIFFVQFLPNLGNNINQLSSASPSSEWATYSDKGVTFQYPSSWTVEFAEQNGGGIDVRNPQTMENGISIGLPSQPTQDISHQYPTLKDYATDIIGKMALVTVVEDFTDKTIGGSPAVMGKVTMGPIISTMAFIDYNGQIYMLGYSDLADHYETIDSKKIEASFFFSFSFI